jgi:hypothetical protein
VEVTAKTYADDDRELPAREVTGEHTTREVPALGYTQHLVGGVVVDPATIRPVPGKPVPAN